MSKEKKVVSAPVVVSEPVVEPQPVAVPSVSTVPPSPPKPQFFEVTPPVPNKLSEVDKLSLDLARAKRQTVLAEAKTALANNENAELSYKYLILQLYMKYSLTAADAISEAGDIVFGGAVQRPQ
jgi:hypothetical protein